MTLKEYRKNKNLTQGELAKKVGVSESYVWCVENFKRRAGWDTAKKWAEVLDIPNNKIVQLFFETKSDLKSSKRKTA